ncbi:MAG: serine/threonine-protein kinase [Planctomycetota bacterium]
MNRIEDAEETLDSLSHPGEGQNESLTHAFSGDFVHGATATSAQRVRVLSQAAPGFTSETAAILRSRLVGYTMVTLAILVVGFLATLAAPEPLFLYRLFVLLVMLGSLILVRGPREFTLQQLRWIEIICITALLSQVCAMSWLRIEGFVNAGDLPSTVAASQFFYTLICLVILAYGIFIPNSWKRALMVLVPIAALPWGVLGTLRAINADFASMLGEYQLLKPIPETLVAAGIAAFGSQVIQGVRKEAFRAKQLGQYVLGDPIGSGGMGEVFRAEHRMLKRPCAIKLIRPSSANDAAAIDRFELEVRATARLSHWNSVEVYDYGRTDDGTFYYVMELLPGATLGDIIKRHGVMPPQRVIHFLVQVCDALSEAHIQGLIHRDIKPANIFASHRGGVADVAKLLDFGLVRQTESDSQQASTFSGTPQYMPPEQATNYEEVDGRGDIYALGAVACFLLTGRPPFEGTVVELLMKHRTAVPSSLREKRSEISEDLEKVVMRCLEKKPAERFQTAGELRDALLACELAGSWSNAEALQWWDEHPMDSSSWPSLLTTNASDQTATLDWSQAR